ncbi:tagaturonate reductase [Dyadobacter frigoris]|uniref:Tagaturonate reductase n=1 Tax=Dyadobacter frigoris TaxID=2576211 RepID=A0A4U6DC96_9BACT|nr:tagaturonate reductase [Dyadobacter frigoris]TKT91984.1 tagaturonate reductase [Dyadobacter frigoris]GLU53141.1 altronate oxidoreductase [Dyadobacter frigoris]
MNQLFREHLRRLRNNPDVIVPDDSIFQLPEKIIQFGTGAFLRGLADYYVDKANRQGIFNGRIVVIKSTDQGDLKAFERQDNLYTLAMKGVQNGKLVEETIISSSISRVLSAKNQWSLVLDCARNPAIKIAFSNTTELGIQLVQDDIYQWPPVSFPGKLLAFLYTRFKAFGGNPDAGLVIAPTELISDNGKKLESIVLELAHRNGLESSFIDWLEQCNSFCNSLVDRIVPGRPDDLIKKEIEEQLGYKDDLMIISEYYGLWAIEGDQKVKEILSFSQVDSGVIIEPDIELYRELKLRILNGAHTLGCGLAYLSGFQTVAKAMEDELFSAFITNLIQNEIAVAIPYPVSTERTQKFSKLILDRFRNPYIGHKWINITHNYSAKINSRVIPAFLEFNKEYGVAPEYMTFGFAVYIFFMKATRKDSDNYYGFSNGTYYLIQDQRAAYFYQKWQLSSLPEMVHLILKDPFIWGTDLTKLGVSEDNVVHYLESLVTHGAAQTLAEFLTKNEYAKI